MYKQAGIVVRKVRIGNIVANIYFEDINLPWLILLPGLPQYFHKQSYFQELIKKYVVLTPYYPGSFHSYGEFKLNQLEEVIPKCFEFINKREFYDFFESKLYKHSGKIEGIMGLSFGANLILDYLNKNDVNKNIIFCLISPIFDMNNEKVEDYWNKKLGFLATEVYTQIYKQLDIDELKKFFKQLTETKNSTNSNIFVIAGDGDKYVTKDFIKSYFPKARHHFFEGIGHEVDKLLELVLDNHIIF